MDTIEYETGVTFAVRLPEQAREKLERLQIAREDANAMRVAAMDARREAAAELRHARTNLESTLASIAARNGWTPPAITEEDRLDLYASKDPLVRTYRATYERAKREFDRRREADEARDARALPLVALVQNLEDALRKLPEGVRLVPVKTPEARIKAPVQDAIAAVRAEVRTVEADLRATQAAPVTSAMAKAMARQQIEELADSGKPYLSELIDAGRPMSFRWKSHTTPLSQTILVPDSVGLLCWLHRDALIAAVEREIDDLASDEHALDDATRARRLSQLSSRRLELERHEESLIELAASQGLDLPRRPNADVRAVLGVDILHQVEELEDVAA